MREEDGNARSEGGLVPRGWNEQTGVVTRARRVRRLVLASRDLGLLRRLSARGHREPVELAATDDPASVRDELLAAGTAALVDGREPDLLEAASIRGPGSVTGDLLLREAQAPDAKPLAFPRSQFERVLEHVRRAAGEPSAPDAADRILGISEAMDRVRRQVRSVADYPDVAVLVLGPTGTGKELVAQTIHALTHEGDAPFVAVNCAAIPEHLVESELFGHTAGAFTGARAARPGLMEEAAGGTLFLDEIGEMPLALQGKLLRVLEARRFRRVGANQDVPLQARIVSATNRRPDPDGERLRRDLYYRLAGFTIRLTKLDRRPVDLAPIADHFARGFAGRYGQRFKRLLDAAHEELARRSWPGNARELRAVVEHAAILAADRPIGAEHVRAALASRLTLPPSSLPPREAASDAAPAVPPAPPLPRSLHAMERQLIERTMDECDGNVSLAARRLEIPRSTLRDKLRRYEEHG